MALAGIVGLGCGLSALAVSASGAMIGVAWAPWLAVCGILVFRLSFSCSMGPIPYVVTAEAGAGWIVVSCGAPTVSYCLMKWNPSATSLDNCT